ncbi:hypothetical protein [Kribbella sp. VKM Ac-2566]|uniref:hypothetical protein n=1 Tax=Kribbella sp. VKM Ac-2566 TaxID=2512218 RepID=UPI0010625CD3|nr:hypothetical protein [Kribbella sp. VKM Ac-2566]
MSAELSAALIAGGVSLLVAIATVAVTAATTRAALQREQARQETDLRRKMTDRLYDRRVATYPVLFAATGAFRWSAMSNASDLPQHLRASIANIDELHSGELGLLLSATAHRALLELRRAVKRLAGARLDGAELEHATQQIWRCKNALRDALRTDLGLLFEEEPASMIREVSQSQADEER